MLQEQLQKKVANDQSLQCASFFFFFVSIPVFLCFKSCFPVRAPKNCLCSYNFKLITCVCLNKLPLQPRDIPGTSFCMFTYVCDINANKLYMYVLRFHLRHTTTNSRLSRRIQLLAQHRPTQGQYCSTMVPHWINVPCCQRSFWLTNWWKAMVRLKHHAKAETKQQCSFSSYYTAHNSSATRPTVARKKKIEHTEAQKSCGQTEE